MATLSLKRVSIAYLSVQTNLIIKDHHHHHSHACIGQRGFSPSSFAPQRRFLFLLLLERLERLT
jgi:hypothetical protein